MRNVNFYELWGLAQAHVVCVALVDICKMSRQALLSFLKPKPLWQLGLSQPSLSSLINITMLETRETHRHFTA